MPDLSRTLYGDVHFTAHCSAEFLDRVCEQSPGDRGGYAKRTCDVVGGGATPVFPHDDLLLPFGQIQKEAVKQVPGLPKSDTLLRVGLNGR